jgi:error-prone DNA polymerase
MTPYAELQVTTNFSFLRGASHAHELVAQAVALGHEAIAVADRNTLAGVVRMHIAAKEAGLRLVVGARLDLRDGASLLAFPEDRAAYGRLSRLITLGRRRAPKGDCDLTRADVFQHGAGMLFVLLPPEPPALPDDRFADELRALAVAFPDRCYLAAQNLLQGDDDRRLAQLAALADACGVPLVATNDVHMHEPSRRPLADVVACIREHCTIDAAGYRLAANAERRLKSPEAMARLFRDYPDALARTVEIAGRCRFSLDELRYEYPDEVVDPGATAQESLARLTWEGARVRYPGGVPKQVRTLVEHELALIEQLGYAPYFLTVQDIVRFARERGILCQGRGSAANSAICYCLGITAVDPSHLDLLFERFVSLERKEPPDIDVDFEHERREEVIQYIYEKYGRERAGMTAVVSCYRARGAIREVGKALGLSVDTVTALAGQVWGWSSDGIDDGQVREIGLDPDDRRLRLALHLTGILIGFPRHLSQHVGGFVISRGPLCEMVPIENAAMADRTVIEWDKDDLDALGILKIDVLSLGMLTCIRKGFDLIRRHYGKDYDLATIPAEDPATCCAGRIRSASSRSRAAPRWPSCRA